MDKNVNKNLYQLWRRDYTHKCKTFEDFLGWVSSLDYYNDVVPNHDMKILEVGGDHIVIPKKLWQRLFLNVGKGYIKVYNTYRVRLKVDKKIKEFGSHYDEREAAKEYLRLKMILTMDDFATFPQELVVTCINEFIIKYYALHGKIKLQEFLI